MAKTSQETILEALAGLIPEEAQEKVSTAVVAYLDEATADIEKEAADKLEDAYQIIADEREKDWQVAEEGYGQAYGIIADLRARLETQRDEFEQTLEEEFASAYEMLQEERKKNQDIEQVLYEEFDNKLKSIKEYMVDRVDAFLGEQGEEYYEMARREVLSDPCMAEHRVALESILDITRQFLSDEDAMLSSSSQADELSRQLEQVEVAKRRLEAKNMRLMTENSKMQEYLTETKEIIEQNILNEQNERIEQAQNVEGSGETVNEPEREIVLGEAVESNATNNNETVNYDEPRTITEQWQVLAGLADDRS